MSDFMRQIPFGQLMDWVLSEYKADSSVFGVRKLYKAAAGYGDAGKKTLELFGSKLELPFGPAAGPHTQLAQNLIASYAAGARFFELKTVQVLDGEDLPVSKPCILAKDEGYNVEWSTELYVPQALEEYIKGWFAIKLLSRELGLGDENGFIFNMSVGYDLVGIKTPKIDNFIEGLKNAENTNCFKQCRQWVLDNLTKFSLVDEDFVNDITPEICNSITLSTLHGCPPLEIERIATYLLEEKSLHTFIKCNPTLLGYDYARETMDKLGFDYLCFDDHHFKADLQFDDAVPMLKRLQNLADGLSLEFGVKLTNTFPVKIAEKELPGEEMYMSGRSLFPLSIEVANRLSKAFDGNLRISFSGGADVRNIAEILATGIWPVTLATTLLKPGGYQRLYQIADEFTQGDGSFVRFHQEKQTTEIFTPHGRNEMSPSPCAIDLSKLKLLINNLFNDPMYRKPAGMPPERKIDKKVPITDCFIAPCREGCPFGQDVPAYLRLAGEGKYLEALRVITERNPLPFITGTICSHNCMNKCTRSFYENSVGIRSVKLETAENAFEQLLSDITAPPKSGGKVAVVGGGPAGLAAAYFLAKAGRPVTIFEQKKSLGGIVRHVIPDFRISDTAIENDIKLVKSMGVEIKSNTKVKSLEELRDAGFESTVIATGAWAPGKVDLENGMTLDALEFLSHIRQGDGSSVSPAAKTDEPSPCLPAVSSKIFGENIVVVGGGNTAMDTARAAKRIPGVSRVSIVYRRTKRYMPADVEELMLAQEDGVEFYELLAPKSLENGKLICEQMELGQPDASCRRSPVATDRLVEVPADTVIAAIGNKVNCHLCGKDEKDVYIIGDAVRGPATVAEAIADAAKCVSTITGIDFDKYIDLNLSDNINAAKEKKGILYNDVSGCSESGRCLECRTICENCVDVCPNRANISVPVDGRSQIVHIDFMCNECGNCEAFCPYSSAPYLDKLTFFIYEDDFENSKNPGFLPLPDGTTRLRLDGVITNHHDGSDIPEDIRKLIISFLAKMNTWFT